MARLEEDLVSDGQLERLHAALVQALRVSRRVPFEQPVTVAEIYQDLVPYRTVRAELGFDMNADYEHTLLRLLSGEGDLARLEPPEAAAELRDELDSPNPNVGLFRKFAGCDVWVTPPVAVEAEPEEEMPSWARQPTPWRADDERTDESADVSAATRGATPAYDPIAVTQPDTGGVPAGPEPDAPAPPTDPRPVAAADSAPAGPAADPTGDELRGRAAVASSTPPAEPLAVSADESEEPEYELVPVQRRNSAVADGNGAHCAFCEARLPAHRMLRFCPYCGTDQAHRPCGSCGEAVEPGWRYCVACGSVAPDPL